MAALTHTSALMAHYDKLERRYRPRSQPDYERLVTAADNFDEPIHRWFHMKEAYSAVLLRRLLKDLQLDDAASLRVADPFAGSGTTLVTALQWGAEGDERQVSVIGTEINPFLHLLSATKVDALTLSDEKRAAVARAFESAAVVALSFGGPTPRTPDLQAFRNRDYFPRRQLSDLLRLRAGVEALNNDDLVRRLLLVALGSVVEPASRLRRDGRALRYVPEKTPVEVPMVFARNVKKMASDIRLSTKGGIGDVRLADGRVSLPSDDGDVDLAVFSPPYPNNIDYTEVYKVEAWLLGLIDSQAAFKDQRRSTMRSHPSIRWGLRTDELPKGISRKLDALVAPVLSAVPCDRYAAGRREVIRGYVTDAALVFLHLKGSLAPSGRVVYVVGNSRHGNSIGSVTIAADLLLARTAEHCGFQLDRFIEARRLWRRGDSHLLRESVVVLRHAK